LNEEDKGTVQRLHEHAGDLSKTVGNKRKRMYSFFRLKNISEYHILNILGPENPSVMKPSHRQDENKKLPVFTHKENATLAQRIEVLDWYHGNGKNQMKTAREFELKYPNLRIKQPLISSWLKNEVKWRAEWEVASGKTEREVKRSRQTEHPEVTEMLDLWISKAMHDKVNITGDVLREKWRQFANLAGVPDDERLGLSEGWLYKLKRRHGLKEIRRHGEAGSVDMQKVEVEHKQLKVLIGESGYKLKDVFNMDETGLFYAYAPFFLSLNLFLSHELGVQNAS
jgi:hypothetical protein